MARQQQRATSIAIIVAFLGDDFEVTTRVSITPIANFHQGGLVIYDDNDNYVRFTYAYIDRPTFEFAKEIGGDFQPIQVPSPPNINDFHLRIRKLGVNYYGYYSQDGENWTLIGVHKNVNISLSEIGLLAFNAEDVASIEIPADFNYFRVTLACEVPFFSQRDDNWQTHPLRGSYSRRCVDPKSGFVTIGTCGCTLTSAAMVFNMYGADTNPPQLSDCMDTSACAFSWNTSLSCSNGKINHVSRVGFSWERLDQELNQNHRAVILGMCKRGTCHLDYDDDPNTHALTHWVVVISGQGTDPEYYLMHDPWYKCGANIPLATRSQDWQFVWMSIYEGEIPCGSLSTIVPPCVNRGANPQPVRFGSSENSTYSRLNVSSSSVISGEVWVYTRTALTMTVEITATSSVGNIAEMLIWTDTLSNTTWQPFTPFVWLPTSEYVYARFRDNLGNVTEAYSDTINPVGPTNAPFEIFLPVIKR